MSSTENVPEYLYVDQQRLDRYADATGSPLIFERAVVLKGGLGWSPTIEAELTPTARPLTRDEKIDRLRKFLRQHNYVRDGRFQGREAFTHDVPVFRLETCDAVSVHIPAATPEMLVPEVADMGTDLPPSNFPGSQKRLAEQERKERAHASRREKLLQRAKEQLKGFEGINLWISDRHHAGPSNPNKQGQLFLIIGFPRDDEPHFRAVSAYSALVGLFEELANEFRKSILFGVASEDLSHARPSQFHQRFLTDPLDALRSVGAEFLGWRTITALYRVRDAILYKEPADGVESTATIGYPIYITAPRF